jgi:hypothetical protein
VGDSFEDRLNAPTPPDRIHAAEVDLLGETHTIQPEQRYHGIMRFDWHRPDGRKLTYGRWTDEDGEWFYPVDELMRRAALSPSDDA